MAQRLFIVLIIFLMAACNTDKSPGQWNLNKTVGWESVNPDDYSILIIKWNHPSADSSQISQKKKLDQEVLKELTSKHLGKQTEIDEPIETDLHFAVSKDFKEALVVILSIAKNLNVEQKIIVYERDYDSFEKWVDRIVYPK